MIQVFFQYIKNSDNAEVVVAVIALVASVIAFLWGLYHQRKLDTLNKLTELRTKYPNSDKLDEKGRENYLRELEFFATGVNTHIYSYKIVKKMSRARLKSQYNNWIYGTIQKIRGNDNNKDAYKECERMMERLKNSSESKLIRRMKLNIQFCIQKTDTGQKFIKILGKYWILIGLVATLIIKIIFSPAPMMEWLSKIEFCNKILLRPAEKTVYFEVLSLLDAVATSFVASLVFYGLNVVLPSREKNKQIQGEIQDIATRILDEIRKPHARCANEYHKQPQFNIAVASEEDIKLFLQTMNYEKELCYEKDEFVEGIELVRTSTQRIEEYIRELRRVYLSSLNSEQLNILRDLQNSLYIEEFKRYYQHLHSINRFSVPEHVLKEKYKNYKDEKPDGEGGINQDSFKIEQALYDASVLYKRLKEAFKI